MFATTAAPSGTTTLALSRSGFASDVLSTRKRGAFFPLIRYRSSPCTANSRTLSSTPTMRRHGTRSCCNWLRGAEHGEERQLVGLQTRSRRGGIAEDGLWRRVGLRNPEQEHAAVEVLLGGRHAGAHLLLLIEVEAALVRQPFGCGADDVRAGSVDRGTKHPAGSRVEHRHCDQLGASFRDAVRY